MQDAGVKTEEERLKRTRGEAEVFEVGGGGKEGRKLVGGGRGR